MAHLVLITVYYLPPHHTWLLGTQIEAPVHIPPLRNRLAHDGALPTTHHHSKLRTRRPQRRPTSLEAGRAAVAALLRLLSTLTRPTRDTRWQVGSSVELEWSGAVGTTFISATSRPPCWCGWCGWWWLDTVAGAAIRPIDLETIETAPTMVRYC